MSDFLYQTPAGVLEVKTDVFGIYSAQFVDDYDDQLPFKDYDDKWVFHFYGTPLQTAVWQRTMRIPKGETLTYAQLAQAIGVPKAVRAVANALGDNMIVYFVPCHRVVRTDGTLGGYRYGIDRKQKLLESEEALLRENFMK